MRLSGDTDIGLVRSTNQDAFMSGRFENGAAWAIVCDGMGGPGGGSIASEIAIETISSKLTECCRSEMGETALRHCMEVAVQLANRRIYDIARQNPELLGMGTTAVVVIARETSAYIFHVGDSRVYALTEDGLTRLTKDHSMVQVMLDRGELTEEEARTDPRKNILTRALGVDETVEFEYTLAEFPKGSKLLLCTDGLFNTVEEAEILRLAGEWDTDALPEKLIAKANQNGGGDNITAVVIENEFFVKGDAA